MKNSVRIYFNEFKPERLNSEAIKNLKKDEIDAFYDERDRHIKKSIIESEDLTYSMLNKLNFEDVDPLIKKK